MFFKKVLANFCCRVQVSINVYQSDTLAQEKMLAFNIIRVIYLFDKF